MTSARKAWVVAKGWVLWTLDQPIQFHGEWPWLVSDIFMACASPLIPFAALCRALAEGDMREFAWDVMHFFRRELTYDRIRRLKRNDR